jgi:hypothetical protein
MVGSHPMAEVGQEATFVGRVRTDEFLVGAGEVVDRRPARRHRQALLAWSG